MAGLKDGMGCTKLPARFLPIQQTGHILSTLFADEYVNMYAGDILTAMNGGASYEARFDVIGSESKEVCSSR